MPPDSVVLQEGFTYPDLQFTSALLDTVGLRRSEKAAEGRLIRFQLYNHKIGIWVHIVEGHCLKLGGDDHIFLAALGVVSMPQLDHLVKTVFTRDLHLRRNLANERRSVANQHRRNSSGPEVLPSMPQSSPAPPSSQPEPPLPKPTPKRKARRSNPTALIPPHPTLGPIKEEGILPDGRTSPASSDGGRSAIYISSDGSESAARPPRTRRKIYRYDPATVIQISTSSSSSSSSEETGKTKSASTSKWPRGFYVCDIAEGFRICNEDSSDTVQDRFEAFFKVPYRKATYYDNLNRWTAAPQTIRDVSIAAGRTKGGTWNTFKSRCSNDE